MDQGIRRLGMTGARQLSYGAALRQLGPVVYALRLSDGVIKIGFTRNLESREHGVRRQSGNATELLAFQPGTYDDEQAIHARLTEHVAHGREYYHPVPEVLAAVNEMRDALNMPQLSA